MKPISLKIKGINSYVSEQSINFEKLTRTNLFGVFGETGSGKSTILDSIIMALYGTSERDIIQNTINVNVKDAHIVYEFEIKEDDMKYRYLIRRDYKLRPSGLKTTAYLKDVFGNQILCEGSDNVTEKVTEIIGVDKKEFLRCIALPQGEFDRFLLDTPQGRKKTMAKLFDLEAFGNHLLEKLKHRREKVSLEKLKLEEKLSTLNHVTEDNLKKLESDLKTLEHSKINTNFELNNAKNELGIVSEELTNKNKLAEVEAKLTVKKNEKTDIDFIEKQIAFTEKHGSILLLQNKIEITSNQVERTTNLLKSLKNTLLNNQKQTSELENLIIDLNSEINNYQLLINEGEIQKIKLKEFDNIISFKENQINEFKENILLEHKARQEKSIEIEELTAKINILCDQERNLENKFKQNKLIVEKLNLVKVMEARTDFISKLNICKNTISPENLEDISDTKTYEEIHLLLNRLNKFELEQRNELNELKNVLYSLQSSLENADEIKINLEKENIDILKDIKNTNKEKESLENQLKNAYSVVDSSSNNIEYFENNVLKIQKDVALVVIQKRSLDKIARIEEFKRGIEENKDKINIINYQISSLQEDKQQLVIEIEMNTTELIDLQQTLVSLVEDSEKYKQDFDNENLNHINLVLDSNDLEVAKQRVIDYYNRVNYLEQLLAELSEKVQNSTATALLLKQCEFKVKTLETRLSSINVNLTLVKRDYELNKENLETALRLRAEYEKVSKDFNTIVELQKLLKGEALLDYVAEEYMYLVTDFANKFVYKISKGKYLLYYNGDFQVIDNFNGGISRGVKTLSGGERFIISLSIALGMSQSIATSKRKNFNFFFIDEGFGSLSDNYLEQVLQSFDVLIKLDFTVGFISHVEKMQHFLTNKVIVTKTTNEQGSKIKQYF